MRRRLRDESGFSLLELQVAELLGGFVITAAIMMMIVAVNSSNRVTDRVNAAQVGRTSMEQIQQRLRSQTCLFPGEYRINGSTAAVGSQAAILHASGDRIVFIGDLGSTGGATGVTASASFRPQLRYIYLVTEETGRRGRLVEGWRTSSATSSTGPYSFGITPATSFAGLSSVNGINAVPPTTVRAMAEGVTYMVGETAAVGATGPTVPLFRYYDASGAQIAESSGAIPTGVLGSITQVTVGFKILGASGTDQRGSGPTAVDKRTASFRNEIYLRTIADRCE